MFHVKHSELGSGVGEDAFGLAELGIGGAEEQRRSGFDESDGFDGLEKVFFNMHKGLIVVIIRTVEMLTTLVSPRQLGNSLFFGVCRASSRPQHQLSQKLSFQGIGRFCAFFQLVLPMLFRNTDERVRGRLSLRVSCGAFLQGRFSSPVDEEGGWQARLAEANPPCRFRLPSPSGTCVRAGNAHRVCEGCLAKRRIRTAPEMFHVKHFDDRRMQPAPPQAESRTAATSRRPRRRKPKVAQPPQAAGPAAASRRPRRRHKPQPPSPSGTPREQRTPPRQGVRFRG